MPIGRLTESVAERHVAIHSDDDEEEDDDDRVIEGGFESTGTQTKSRRVSVFTDADNEDQREDHQSDNPSTRSDKRLSTPSAFHAPIALDCRLHPTGLWFRSKETEHYYLVNRIRRHEAKIAFVLCILVLLINAPAIFLFGDSLADKAFRIFIVLKLLFLVAIMALLLFTEHGCWYAEPKTGSSSSSFSSAETSAESNSRAAGRRKRRALYSPIRAQASTAFLVEVCSAATFVFSLRQALAPMATCEPLEHQYAYYDRCVGGTLLGYAVMYPVALMCVTHVRGMWVLVGWFASLVIAFGSAFNTPKLRVSSLFPQDQAGLLVMSIALICLGAAFTMLLERWARSFFIRSVRLGKNIAEGKSLRKNLERTLLQLLPHDTLHQLQIGEKVVYSSKECTVGILSIHDFSAWCQTLLPSKINVILDVFLQRVDEWVNDHFSERGIRRLLMAGDTYVVVTGLQKTSERSSAGGEGSTSTSIATATETTGSSSPSHGSHGPAAHPASFESSSSAMPILLLFIRVLSFAHPLKRNYQMNVSFGVGTESLIALVFGTYNFRFSFRGRAYENAKAALRQAAAMTCVACQRTVSLLDRSAVHFTPVGEAAAGGGGGTEGTCRTFFLFNKFHRDEGTKAKRSTPLAFLPAPKGGTVETTLSRTETTAPTSFSAVVPTNGTSPQAAGDLSPTSHNLHMAKDRLDNIQTSTARADRKRSWWNLSFNDEAIEKKYFQNVRRGRTAYLEPFGALMFVFSVSVLIGLLNVLNEINTWVSSLSVLLLLLVNAAHFALFMHHSRYLRWSYHLVTPLTSLLFVLAVQGTSATSVLNSEIYWMMMPLSFLLSLQSAVVSYVDAIPTICVTLAAYVLRHVLRPTASRLRFETVVFGLIYFVMGGFLLLREKRRRELFATSMFLAETATVVEDAHARTTEIFSKILPPLMVAAALQKGVVSEERERTVVHSCDDMVMVSISLRPTQSHSSWMSRAASPAPFAKADSFHGNSAVSQETNNSGTTDVSCLSLTVPRSSPGSSGTSFHREASYSSSQTSTTADMEEVERFSDLYSVVDEVVGSQEVGFASIITAIGDTIVVGGPFTFDPPNKNEVPLTDATAKRSARFVAAQHAARLLLSVVDRVRQRFPTTSTTIVMCRGVGYAVVLGRYQPSIDILGPVKEELLALEAAAPPGFVGATESLMNLLAMQTTNLRSANTMAAASASSSPPHSPTASAANFESATLPMPGTTASGTSSSRLSRRRPLIPGTETLHQGDATSWRLRGTRKLLMIAFHGPPPPKPVEASATH